MDIYTPDEKAQDTEITLQQLAREAAACFTTEQRPEGDSFVGLLDGSPDWVSELVRDAHGDMLPDHWRYASIESALDWIADANDPVDEQYEWADGNMDVYNRGRLAWLASYASRPSYCDDATSEMGRLRPTASLTASAWVSIRRAAKCSPQFSIRSGPESRKYSIRDVCMYGTQPRT